MPDTPDTPSDSSLEVLRYDCLSLSSGDLATVSPPQEPVAKNNASEKIRLGRKGRSKSRTGCLNCKRARIKVRCSEILDIGKETCLLVKVQGESPNM